MKYTCVDKWLKIEINSLFVSTVQEFFDEYIPSSKIQHLLIQNKHILIDGNACKRESELAGLYLEIYLYPNTYDYQKLNLKLNVVYEDEIILVVNKPKDLLVHSDGNKEITLCDMVKSYYSDSNYIEVDPIQRLDKQTSGLVLFSKSKIFKPILDKLLLEKKISRIYTAIVEGLIEKGETITINKPIGKDRHIDNKRVITATGQKAITKIKGLKVNKNKNYSIIECTLLTGRTHQIRVHTQSIHHPIINDEIYGSKSTLTSRMGLVASSISFYHPLKEEYVNLEIPLPLDLEKLYMEAK